MKRYKVLHVIRPAAGGMKRHLLTLVKYAPRGGFELGVAGPPGDMLAAAAELGAKVFPIPLKGGLNPVQDARAVLQLARLLKEERVTIVHAHGSKAGLVGRVAARVAGTPIVFFTAHNSIFYEEWPDYKKSAFALVEKMLARNTYRIITVSEALRQELVAKEGLKPEQVVTVFNGIETDEFEIAESRTVLRQRLCLLRKALVVGTVARLAPQKGVRYIVEAAGLFHPDERPLFLVVGDGPLREELQALARKVGVADSVVFTGMREDIPLLLAALDLLVVPSVTEGLPLILLEGMAAALPVVATAVGGIPEAVVDGETGILVPPQNAEALASGINRILRNPDRARELGAAGRRRVRELFTAQRMVGRVAELYGEAIAGKGL